MAETAVAGTPAEPNGGTSTEPQQSEHTGQSVTPPQTNEWETKYKDLESKSKEYEDMVRTAELFLSADHNSRSRFEKWQKGQSLDDIIPDAPKGRGKDEKSFDPETFKQGLLNEVEQTTVAPLKRQMAEIAVEREKLNLQKELPWFTDEVHARVDENFGKELVKRAQEIAQTYNLAPNVAYDMATKEYKNWTLKDLAKKFAEDEWVKNASGLSRMKPKAPPGMIGVSNAAGITPDLLEQAKKAYAEVQNNPNDAGRVVQEYADKAGMTMTELYKVLNDN